MLAITCNFHLLWVAVASHKFKWVNSRFCWNKGLQVQSLDFHNAALLLVDCMQRWLNMKATLGQCLVFAELSIYRYT